MEPRRNSGRYAHPVRGTLAALVLGAPMLLFGLTAAFALLDQFIAGFVPTRWFSNNALDWMMSFGTVGGAANYFTVMINGVLAYLCYAGIARAFTGKWPDSST